MSRAPAGRVLGAIFAGGSASRFGADKAQALWRGVPLLGHVIARLQHQADMLVLLGGGARHGLTALPDRPAPGLGPLGGLAAALHHAAHAGFTWVLTAPCDAPLLPLDLAAMLRTTVAQQNRAAAFAQSVERRHPAFALWRADLGPVLDSYLANAQTARDRAVHRFASAVDAVPTLFPDAIAFANVNSPEDLAALPTGLVIPQPSGR